MLSHKIDKTMLDVKKTSSQKRLHNLICKHILFRRKEEISLLIHSVLMFLSSYGLPTATPHFIFIALEKFSSSLLFYFRVEQPKNFIDEQ